MPNNINCSKLILITLCSISAILIFTSNSVLAAAAMPQYRELSPAEIPEARITHNEELTNLRNQRTDILFSNRQDLTGWKQAYYDKETAKAAYRFDNPNSPNRGYRADPTYQAAKEQLNASQPYRMRRFQVNLNKTGLAALDPNHRNTPLYNHNARKAAISYYQQKLVPSRSGIVNRWRNFTGYNQRNNAKLNRAIFTPGWGVNKFNQMRTGFARSRFLSRQF